MKHRRTISCLLTGICCLFGDMRLANAQNAQTQGTQQEAREQIFVSLKDVIDLALKNNLEISIQQMNPQMIEQEILSAESAFDMSAESGVTYTVNEADSDTSPFGVANLNGGIARRLQTGTSYSLKLNIDTSLFDGKVTGMTLDPATGSAVQYSKDIEDSYETSLKFSLSHPTMKNAGKDVNTTQIRIAKAKRDTSVSELQATVIDVVTRAQNAYWDLVNARADLESARMSLDLANNLVRINEAQVDVGTLAPIEVLSAKAQAASRSVEVTSAELAVQTKEDQLRQLLNLSEYDPLWNAIILPTDQPSESKFSLSLDECIQTALANREELKQFRNAINIQDISLKYLQNQLLPEVNLVGGVGVTGKDTSLGDSMGGFATADEFNVTVGGSFSYPLGNRAAKSAYNKAKLEMDQTRLSLRNTEQQIAVAVRITFRAVETTYNLIQATRVARQLAQEQLDAEQKKFNEGLSTNFQVLDYQDKLTQARTAESQAITSYNKALVSLAEAMGMTLQQHHIDFESQPVSDTPPPVNNAD